MKQQTMFGASAEETRDMNPYRTRSLRCETHPYRQPCQVRIQDSPGHGIPPRPVPSHRCARAPTCRIDGLGYLCRAHAPLGRRCYTCERVRCAAPGGRSCLITALRRLAIAQGWSPAGRDAHTLKRLGLPLLMIPSSALGDSIWVPDELLRWWRRASAAPRRPKALAELPVRLAGYRPPPAPSGEFDEVLQRFLRYRALDRLGGRQ